MYLTLLIPELIKMWNKTKMKKKSIQKKKQSINLKNSQVYQQLMFLKRIIRRNMLMNLPQNQVIINLIKTSKRKLSNMSQFNLKKILSLTTILQSIIKRLTIMKWSQNLPINLAFNLAPSKTSISTKCNPLNSQTKGKSNGKPWMNGRK